MNDEIIYDLTIEEITNFLPQNSTDTITTLNQSSEFITKKLNVLFTALDKLDASTLATNPNTYKELLLALQKCIHQLKIIIHANQTSSQCYNGSGMGREALSKKIKVCTIKHALLLARALNLLSIHRSAFESLTGETLPTITDIYAIWRKQHERQNRRHKLQNGILGGNQQNGPQNALGEGIYAGHEDSHTVTQKPYTTPNPNDLQEFYLGLKHTRYTQEQLAALEKRQNQLQEDFFNKVKNGMPVGIIHDMGLEPNLTLPKVQCYAFKQAAGGEIYYTPRSSFASTAQSYAPGGNTSSFYVVGSQPQGNIRSIYSPTKTFFNNIRSTNIFQAEGVIELRVYNIAGGYLLATHYAPSVYGNITDMYHNPTPNNVQTECFDIALKSGFVAAGTYIASLAPRLFGPTITIYAAAHANYYYSDFMTPEHFPGITNNATYKNAETKLPGLTPGKIFYMPSVFPELYQAAHKGNSLGTYQNRQTTLPQPLKPGIYTSRLCLKEPKFFYVEGPVYKIQNKQPNLLTITTKNPTKRNVEDIAPGGLSLYESGIQPVFGGTSPKHYDLSPKPRKRHQHNAPITEKTTLFNIHK